MVVHSNRHKSRSLAAISYLVVEAVKNFDAHHTGPLSVDGCMDDGSIKKSRNQSINRSTSRRQLTWPSSRLKLWAHEPSEWQLVRHPSMQRGTQVCSSIWFLFDIVYQHKM